MMNKEELLAEKEKALAKLELWGHNKYLRKKYAVALAEVEKKLAVFKVPIPVPKPKKTSFFKKKSKK